MNNSDQTPFDTATRIAAGDDGSRYDRASIWLHWATAVLVVVQFALAQTWDWFSKTTASDMQSIHVSLGVLLAAVIITRLGWRFMPGHQISSLETGWVKLASRIVHLLLYALIVGEVGLGFAFRWSQGHAVQFFGLGIASPFGQFSKAARHQLHTLHEYVAWAIIILALAHALAALYHHYVVKDRVLVRMLPRGAERTA